MDATGHPAVLLVEDDDFTRVTVASALRLLGFDVVAEVGSAAAAMAAAAEHPLTAAVLDLDLGPGPNGIDVAFGLRNLHPAIGIVILTSFADPRLLASSVNAPPPGGTYVVKQSLTDIAFLGEAVTGAIGWQGAAAAFAPRVDLTDAQIDTLRLLAYGLSNAEIARIRVVEERSVEQSIARIAKRLGISAAGPLNQRVALAREYFKLTGAERQARAQH